MGECITHSDNVYNVHKRLIIHLPMLHDTLPYIHSHKIKSLFTIVFSKSLRVVKII